MCVCAPWTAEPTHLAEYVNITRAADWKRFGIAAVAVVVVVVAWWLLLFWLYLCPGSRLGACLRCLIPPPPRPAPFLLLVMFICLFICRSL